MIKINEFELTQFQYPFHAYITTLPLGQHSGTLHSFNDN